MYYYYYYYMTIVYAAALSNHRTPFDHSANIIYIYYIIYRYII